MVSLRDNIEVQPLSHNKRVRKNFGHINLVADIPNLIEIQKNSYEKNFLQLDTKDSERKNKGLQSILNSIFPISDPSNIANLEFVKYEFDTPKYDVEECTQRSLSYDSALKVTLRLSIWDIDEDTGSREIKGIKEQQVYMGNIPLMTKNGTFIINGTERVVVSQMHRSPGVFFYHDEGKVHSSRKLLYSARVIPYRGSWLDLEFDAKDIIYFRIDRKRKLYATTLLKAIGMSTEEIIKFYYDSVNYKVVKNKGWAVKFMPSHITAHRLTSDLIDADTGNVLLKAGQKITPRLAKKYAGEGLNNILVSHEALIGKYLSEDLKDPESDEILAKIGEMITVELLSVISDLKIKNISVLVINPQSGPYIRNTLFSDKNQDRESALFDIFRVLRPGEPANIEAAESLFYNLFFDPERYDLSEVGRIKMNSRLELNISDETTVLTTDDIKNILRVLVELKDRKGIIDDIDHLGNRRVRSVGELIENQFRIGLVRMEKSVVERMSAGDIDTVMPHDLVNSKILVSVVKEFFSTSQLSQFMDQTNPLSEITHKRRLSALGPGGLSRDRAGFEVRDVHPTHYGRICPIETPEGQNIGLINSMATYARINKHGFIESPYRKVKDGHVTDEVVYLSAIEEGKYKIGQANSKVDKDGILQGEFINCRVEGGNFVMVEPHEVDFIDVTPMQVVSVAASLIPFLENDDANRALMGSNMQRQAVPLIKTDAPFVGTGVEGVVAKDSGASVLALNDGIVEQVDSNRIVIRAIGQKTESAPSVDIYNLLKFQKSNHNTCINQKPLVKVGHYVKKNDIIADGPSTDNGEIALGRNVLVAFLPWNGYNFEDSILISERIVKEDVFTSVHIEEFEVIARDTRLGPEEITRDIPNVSEEALRHLDEVGIIYVGAEVKAGDILVGKVTPKSESPITPEEKLLRAIFGEKAFDVKDSSLHVPSGVSGTVVEVRVFSRRGVEKDQRAIAIEKQQIEKLAKDRDDELEIIEHFVFSWLEKLLVGQVSINGPKTVKTGQTITSEILKGLSKGQLWQFTVEDANVMNEIEQLKGHYDGKKEALNKRFATKVEKLQSGDDLPQGALKVVKVFIATKHKLQPGDKMAGRHGNKGVISRIVPEEDMPFLEDGTVVDIVLNPLGLPSRMNIGQVLETHLGWASVNLAKKIAGLVEEHKTKHASIEKIKKFLIELYGENINHILEKSDEEIISFCNEAAKGVYFATPVFDGAKVEDVKDMLRLAGQDLSGQVKLIDGRTGEYFDRLVTVGQKYLLKLHHLVDNKIHSRSIGPYSLVTQQPLGGKSHFGGQRFGEMECWALQAYGAAYTLQEMLTVKSDDVNGRIKIYDSIVRGENNFESGIPESFNVMIKEFRSLCLNVKLEVTS
ncbi:DNA-directed RNA polymerase subunit beta [Rickettsia bellii OSU 85-389]|uniref:DNA-directed RNA polymerase subunit beta n=2 Tax=Rickettsia bellii TaxID=33990 RepID=RPOB_RICB8|nr:DNA-directed RNA polymerase subunit beta [Rickettsia bellii]A8GV24.1 RecName: Full=DNA-directed RNA polymerase subunit beta; Short=RNAP subunit beta; AltName: Full=RNA polymerase subunit beta; AltName: Full=Transcriptase subunit beta [Rickettsia bellii OSU 85-389]ABV78695.1 DNA-directed RNA polymerase subunit beta [Rickettsia bellii OSU 85-389]